MNKKRIPRQHRRFSLPSTSTLSPFGLTRTFPEGSDIFQKAYEDLCANEPNHAPTSSGNGLGFNGLTNIQEGNESDVAESEEESDVTEEIPSRSRRHSSPSCFQREIETATEEEETPEKIKAQNKDRDSILKMHHQFRKEYFIKNGRWPVSKATNHVVKQRLSSYNKGGPKK